MVGRAQSELTPVPVVLPPPPGAGSTLADVLRRGPMAVDQAVARIGLIAEAIAAQRLGNHGQLTPWHVQFESADGSGRPRIGGRELTVDPLYAGLYRAPELEFADDPAASSPSVEVYALGCILFEAIAGRAPFQAANLSELVKKHGTAAAPAVRMVRRECALPPSLELEIQRALKKRPGDRHASATAFAMAIRASNREDDRSTIALNASHTQALQEMLGGRAAEPAASRSTPAPSLVGGAAAEPARQPTPAAAAVPPPASRASNAILVAALIAILGLGAGLLYYMLGGDQEPAPAAAVPTPEVADVAPAAPADVVDAEDTDTADSDASDADADAEVEVAEDIEIPQVIEPAKVRPKVRPKPTPDGPKPEPKRDGPAVF